MTKIATTNNLADPFIKSLAAKSFDSHVKRDKNEMCCIMTLSLSERLLDIYMLKAMHYVVVLFFIT